MLSKISIENPVFAWMLMIGLVLFGLVSFERMGVSELPDVDFPVVSVRLTLEGASPEVMESEVVDPIEDVMMGVEGVTHIQSEIYSGSAEITVDLALDRDVDAAVQEIQSKFEEARKRRPPDLDPPIIVRTNPEDDPIMWIAITTNKSPIELMIYVKDVLRQEFQTIPGVAEVSLGGYVDRNMRVWLDGKKMDYYEISVDDVINSITEQHIEVPAGRFEAAGEEYSLRTPGKLETEAQFSKLFLLKRGGAPVLRPVTLGQISRIEDGLDDIRRISRYNGRTAVGISIRKQRGANAVMVGNAVKARIADLQQRMDPNFQMEVAFDGTVFVEEAILELEFTLILAILLTALVTRLFLSSWSATFNILLAIPTSIAGSFIALYFLGFTLNTFTLLALSLAVGIVVDDAIMVLENIMRRHEAGEGPRDAALNGAVQITFAALAATLSVVAIFLPVIYMRDIVGKYFFQFGMTVSFAVLLSLLEALTLTPMRSHSFLEQAEHATSGRLHRLWRRMIRGADQTETAGANGQPRSSEQSGALMNRVVELYRLALEVVLRHPIAVVGVSILLFAGSLLVLIPLKKEFVPNQDRSRLMVFIQAPAGITIDEMDRIAKDCEAQLVKRPEVDRYFAIIGNSRTGLVNRTMLIVTLKAPADRPVDPKSGHKLSQDELSGELRREISKVSPNIRVSVRQPSLKGVSGGRGFPVEIVLKGPDVETLARKSEEIVKAMDADGHFSDVSSSSEPGYGEYHVIPERSEAVIHGVSVATIGRAVGAMVGGTRVGRFNDGGHSYDIRLRLADRERNDIGAIMKLPIRNIYGEMIRLGMVARVEKREGLLSISRENRQRAITISANPAPEVGQFAAIDRAIELGRALIPSGYSVEPTGSSKQSKSSFDDLYIALLLGIVLSYMILGSQFNSFVHPIAILAALPFSITGALIALYLFGQSLNVYSFIGVLLLLGLVKKNSILLVDFANQKREEGMEVREAILAASPIRLRPIIMTSISSIAAAIPAALAFGPGAESRIPMALVVIGGMTLSTLLTLFVIPALYLMLSRFERIRPGEIPRHKV